MGNEWINRAALVARERYKVEQTDKALQLHRAAIIEAKGVDFWRALIDLILADIHAYNRLVSDTPALVVEVVQDSDGAYHIARPHKLGDGLYCILELRKQQIKFRLKNDSQVAGALEFFVSPEDEILVQYNGQQFSRKNMDALAKMLLKPIFDGSPASFGA